MIRSLVPCFLLLAELASPGVAQAPCHVENDGLNYGGGTMGGISMVGVRFVAPTDFDCLGIEIFSGLGGSTTSVAIWSHDAVADEPDAQLGIGSWSMNVHPVWQGASLTNAVHLNAGAVYWMVWQPAVYCYASVDLPMATVGQVHRYSVDGGMSWGQVFQSTYRHWKFRLYGDCDGIGTETCFGDGFYTPCPCGNADPSGTAGCENSSGAGCRLAGSGSNSLAAADLVLHATDALPNQPGIFFQGSALSGAGSGVPFGDGLRCAGIGIVRLELVVPAASGDAASTTAIGATGGVAPGDLRHYQFWYRDPSSGPCGSGFNLSNALSIPWAL